MPFSTSNVWVVVFVGVMSTRCVPYVWLPQPKFSMRRSVVVKVCCARP